MWKWLRSCFAWRFSLTRLVIAVVFLGAFVGLNMRPIGPVNSRDTGLGREIVCLWGWPFPARVREVWPNARESGAIDVRKPLHKRTGTENERIQQYMADITKPTHMRTEAETKRIQQYGAEAGTFWEEASTYQLPLAHQTYRLVAWHSIGTDSGSEPILNIIPNAVFPVVVLALILSLQIPRRKVAAKV